MTKLSQILGFLFLAAGVVLAILCFMLPGWMQVYGVTLELAAILMVGGGICIGIGGLPDALHAEHGGAEDVTHIDDLRRAPPAPVPAERPKLAEVKPRAEFKPAAAVAAVTEGVRPSVAETIEALEQAKNDIASALSIEKPAAEPKPSIAAILEKPFGEKPAKSEPPIVLQMPAPTPPPRRQRQKLWWRKPVRPMKLTIQTSMWLRKKSFAAARRACFPTAQLRQRRTKAGCGSRTLNISTNISTPCRQEPEGSPSIQKSPRWPRAFCVRAYAVRHGNIIIPARLSRNPRNMQSSSAPSFLLQ